MSDLENRDFFTDPSLVADPYPYYDAIRSCPIRKEPHHDVVLVSGYDEFLAVSRDDRETFSTCTVVSGPFSGLPPTSGLDDISDLIEQYRGTMPLHEYFASFDPPRHTNHRALLSRLLTPRRLKENEEFLWRLADRTIDSFIDRQRCELVEDFGTPFTMLAIADLLGVPESDRGRFTRAPELVGDIQGATDKFIGVKEEWFVEYIEDRRRNPRDDVLTKLAQATFPDGSIPDALDVARVAVFLFAAGQGTTVDLLTVALRALAEDPQLQQRLRDDRALIGPFIEEMLRLESPVKSNFRLARKPTSVADFGLDAGTHVMVMVGAANRDPRQFEAPNELRLDRANIREHVAFGRGIHACPGAPLARIEARVSLERLLDRLGDIRVDESAHGTKDARSYDWEASWLLRRLKTLHLEFTSID
ncbi:cytochrome P450 [Mycolicibacterium flavescens]|uniref:cytochrome P450 n=1 Tax=Mycobacterium neumannii TaxID=2048551 RepID=UPI000B93A7D1|nr:cytochrome P450 [Mycobacterium neumannii]VEG43643.1 cytochrome P450 [Mycolicibacterium flavescens]